MADAINPAHYKGLFEMLPHETIMVTRHLDFCMGNYYKYLERLYKKDNPLQDFNKACWYAEDWITHNFTDGDDGRLYNPNAEKAAIAFSFIKEPEHGTELWDRWCLLRVVTEPYILPSTWRYLLEQYKKDHLIEEAAK